jgi:alpha-beta hydrolase superfamily lysophospholipase
MNVTTIVLIPGLWMSARYWEQFVKHYSGKGFSVVVRNWPGMEGDVEHLRRSPNSFASVGLTDVVDHYEKIIRELETPPIIIGHGLGGLVAQILLDRGWGAAGVAIAPVPPKGVFLSPFRRLRLALQGRSLTPPRFHQDFSNTIDQSQSIAAFDRYVVPAPNRILRQVVFSTFLSDGPGNIRFSNDSRAALLLIAGGRDRIVTPSLVKANFDGYRETKVETDYKEYPNESHFSLTQETGVADYALGWALCRVNGARLNAPLTQTDTWSVQLSA